MYYWDSTKYTGYFICSFTNDQSILYMLSIQLTY